jgi:Transposase DDE domain
VESLQSWVARHAAEEAQKPPLKAALEALARVLAQDLEPDPNGGGGRVIRDGVAKDRMPSLGDKEMRHGRKSKSKLFNGFKRHIATAHSLIVAATVLPANQPEHEATAPLLDEAEQHGPADGVLIDRGYLASPRVEALRSEGKEVLCKPWPGRNRGRFTKEDFVIDLAARQLTCPTGQTATIPDSRIVHFAAAACDACQQRADCTAARYGHGRSVTIHAQEALLLELRKLRRTSAGRARLRERVQVEHRLARVSWIQGNRARYKGARKNELDVRRCAAVANLQTIATATEETRRAA